MTKRDLFIIVIKLFGLQALVHFIFSSLPQMLATTSLWVNGSDWSEVIPYLFFALIDIGLFVLLIAMAPKVVSILKLGKGYDDDRVDFGQMRSADVARLGLFIVGGLLFVESASRFVSSSWFAFKAQHVGQAYDWKENIAWASSGSNVIVGYLLIIYHARIAERITPSHRNAEGTTDGRG